MSITKEELVAAINSYATARASGDPTLINFSAKLIEQTIGQINFDANVAAADAVVSDKESLEDSVGG